MPHTNLVLPEYSNLVECGLDANFFVAMHKAHEIANYFGLSRLEDALEKMMAQKLALKAVDSQRNYGSYYGDVVDMERINQTLDGFSDDFFDAVSLIYLAKYPNNDLRKVLVDFGVRSRLATLHHGAFRKGLRKVTTYGTDILIATKMDGIGAYWARPGSCKKCSRQLWEDGRHLIHPYTLNDDAAKHGCSGCLDGQVS